LRRLESRAAELGVGDVQLCLTSLEDVFLAIARKVGGCGWGCGVLGGGQGLGFWVAGVGWGEGGFGWLGWGERVRGRR